MKHVLNKSEFMQLIINHYYEKKRKEKEGSRNSENLKREQIIKCQIKNYKKRGYF